MEVPYPPPTDAMPPGDDDELLLQQQDQGMTARALLGNDEENAYSSSILERVLKNKKRALSMFGEECANEAEFVDEDGNDAFRPLRLKIKRANEYGRIRATVGARKIDHAGAFASAAAAPMSAITDQQLLAIGDALTGTSAASSSRQPHAQTSSATATTLANILPQPVGPARPKPQQAGADGTAIVEAPLLPGQIPGPAAAARPGSSDQSALALNGGRAAGTSAVDPKQVQLSIYREGEQLINVDNPDQRLRAMEKPEWHRPWKLHKVLAGHQGWVRCVAVDPSNEWFVSSGQDRLIKFWDLATGTLKLTLTGHSSTVRALEISKHHPYFYSAGEDNEVRCWDLNTNKIIRTYHGHLSAVYSLKLHPTLDVLASGGRDGTVRIWDIRSRTQIFALQHEGAVNCIESQAAEPQFISGSADNTVKLWDLAAGKSLAVLTNHKKSIRALAVHPKEYTFVSCSAEQNKVWRCPKGVFERNIYGHDGILNCCAIRENLGGATDNSSVLVAGGDDGFLHFWDWKTGYLFQSIEGKPQPGSLSSENAIFGLTFDHSQTRLITAECDKTIKIYKEDFDATEKTHPIGNWRGFLAKNRKR